MAKSTKRTKFVVVGDSYTDYFCFIAGDRLPSAGEDAILQDPIRRFAGGSPINTATHLQALLLLEADADDQHVVTVQTVINEEDQDGKLLLQHAASHGFELVNCCRDNTSGGVTPHCVVMVTGEDRTFLTHSGCASSWTAADVILPSSDETSSCHVHVAGYYSTPGFLRDKSLFRAIQKWKGGDTKQSDTHLTVSLVTQFDVTGEWDGGLVTELMPLLDMLIMNEQEATSIMQKNQCSTTTGSSEIHENKLMIEDWMSFFSEPNVIFVVTMGSSGAVVFQNQSLIAQYCAPLQQTTARVVDPTGAGDAFASGFLHGFFNILPQGQIDRALEWGCCVGSASVCVEGASTNISPELLQELLGHAKAGARGCG